MKKLILTALLGVSSSLFATIIQHTGVDSARGMSIEIKTDGAVHQVTAGVGVLRIDGSSYFDAFCVNLFQGITLYQNYEAVTVSASAFDADGGAAAWIVQHFLPVVNAAAGSTRQVDGAALQLAIWDIIHDGGDGFAAGRVRASSNTNSSVLAVANEWRLASLDQHGAANVFIPAPDTRSFQQQLYVPACAMGGDCGTSGVPEPGTMAMLAVGGAAVLFGASRSREAR